MFEKNGFDKILITFFRSILLTSKLSNLHNSGRFREMNKKAKGMQIFDLIFAIQATHLQRIMRLFNFKLFVMNC
jgi:hypothetical protein